MSAIRPELGGRKGTVDSAAAKKSPIDQGRLAWFELGSNVVFAFVACWTLVSYLIEIVWAEDSSWIGFGAVVPTPAEPISNLQHWAGWWGLVLSVFVLKGAVDSLVQAPFQIVKARGVRAVLEAQKLADKANKAKRERHSNPRRRKTHNRMSADRDKEEVKKPIWEFNYEGIQMTALYTGLVVLLPLAEVARMAMSKNVPVLGVLGLEAAGKFLQDTYQAWGQPGIEAARLFIKETWQDSPVWAQGAMETIWSYLVATFQMSTDGALTWGIFLLRNSTLWALVVFRNEWGDYVANFSWRRRRGERFCPSNKKRPDAGSQNLKNRFSNCTDEEERRTIVQGRIRESISETSEEHFKFDRRGTCGVGRVFVNSSFQRLSISRTNKLDMDHIYLSFSDYLWAGWHVTPPAFTGLLYGGKGSSGLIGILWQRAKFSLGVAAKPPSDELISEWLFKFMTNTCCLVYAIYDGKSKCTWKVDGVTHLLEGGKVEVGTLEMVADMDSETMGGFKFNGREISAYGAFLLSANLSSMQTHPVVHAYANWGLNPELESNWWIRRMGLITVKYNNIGIMAYPWLIECLNQMGITTVSKKTTKLQLHINHNVPPHHDLQGLRERHTFSKFLIDVRRYFLVKFEKYAKDFAGIDGEALFIGTVMHSIDHRQAVYNSVPILIPMDGHVDPEWQLDHENALIALNMSGAKPHYRPYENRYSHAPHPFYREVYEFARTIDQTLADMMEACIGI